MLLWQVILPLSKPWKCPWVTTHHTAREVDSLQSRQSVVSKANTALWAFRKDLVSQSKKKNLWLAGLSECLKDINSWKCICEVLVKIVMDSLSSSHKLDWDHVMASDHTPYWCVFIDILRRSWLNSQKHQDASFKGHHIMRIVAKKAALNNVKAKLYKAWQLVRSSFWVPGIGFHMHFHQVLRISGISSEHDSSHSFRTTSSTFFPFLASIHPSSTS